MIQIVSWGLTVVLAFVAGLHFYWAFGGLWPGRNENDLVRTVIGTPGRNRMPPVWMTLVVALGLAGIASWPIVSSHLVRALAGAPMTVAGSAVLTAIFLARGLAGYVPAWRAIHSAEPFARFDRTRYSPLCLVIGAGFLALTLSEGGH
jgi:Protein of unknown function (DUF3995)